MKRLIILIFLLVAFTTPVTPVSYAGQQQIFGILARKNVTCDDCSGDLSFAFHFENSDTVTDGSPCGCSDGDTVGVRNDSAVYDTIKSDGAYSLDAADRWKYIHFDNDLVGAEEIVAEAAGTIIFDVYFESTTAAKILHIGEDTGGNSDTLYVLLDAGVDIVVWYFGNGTSVDVKSTGSAISQSTWHTITIKWQAAGDPNLYVDVDGGSSDTDNTDLTALEDKWEWIRFGETGANEGDLHIDNVKIYKTYE